MAVYIISVITFGFMISVIFKKPSIASIVGSLIFLLAAIVIFANIGKKFSALSYFTKIIFCLLINTNAGIGMNLISNREIFNGGMNFGDIFDRDNKMNFSFGELLSFMLLGSILQFLIALYIERVFPGDFGMAEPWYFPVQKFIEKCRKSSLNHKLARDDNGFINTDYETEPKNLRVGIEISNMRKNFGPKTAVNNLSLRMFENQITILLGEKKFYIKNFKKLEKLKDKQIKFLRGDFFFF
jgi:ATP-binding cassette subfamily A (ABC1) protein 3